MDDTTLTIVLVGPNRTRLLARLITYVAGRDLEVRRTDFDDHADHSTLLLRISGAARQLAVVPRQVERFVGVESATTQVTLRSGRPSTANTGAPGRRVDTRQARVSTGP